MTVFSKTSMLSVLIGTTLVSSAVAQSVGREFTTSTGETLVLAPIKTMKCAEIDKMLARIDSTGYRGHAPTPHNAKDVPLLEYELLLAEESYNRCVVVRKNATSDSISLQRTNSE